jgi:hypothetical protein
VSDLEWADEALDELADIYVLATPPDREVIARRVLAVNKALRINPLGVGEDRASGLRVDANPVLTVWFRVTNSGQWVRVIHAHRPSPRRSG